MNHLVCHMATSQIFALFLKSSSRCLSASHPLVRTGAFVPGAPAQTVAAQEAAAEPWPSRGGLQ